MSHLFFSEYGNTSLSKRFILFEKTITKCIENIFKRYQKIKQKLENFQIDTNCLTIIIKDTTF